MTLSDRTGKGRRSGAEDGDLRELMRAYQEGAIEAFDATPTQVRSLLLAGHREPTPQSHPEPKGTHVLLRHTENLRNAVRAKYPGIHGLYSVS